MKNFAQLKIALKRLDQLKPDPRNARTHSEKQIRLLANSISAFGFNNPIIIDEDDNILAGHGRYAAAASLGLAEVPAVQISHMTKAQKRAYILADNKLAELAGWDFDVLGEELGLLLDEDINLDIGLTGFDGVEIDRLVFGDGANGEVKKSKADKEKEPVELPGDEKVVTRPGDLWEVGEHHQDES